MANNTSSTAVPATGEEQERQTQQRAKEAEKSRNVGPLQTDEGNTTVADTVVQKIAGLAAREVPGVYAMGSAGRRAFTSISERIPGSQTNVSGGVSVEKGERQAAIDLTIVIENGASIVEVAKMIRRNVIDSVEGTTGLEVLEVNIAVTDVHLPEDDDNDDNEGRGDLK